MKTKTKLLLGFGIASSALAVAVPTTVMLSSCSASNPLPNLKVIVTSANSNTVQGNQSGTPALAIRSDETSNSITITSQSNKNKYFLVYLQPIYFKEVLSQTLDQNDFFTVSAWDMTNLTPEEATKLCSITYEPVGTLPNGWKINNDRGSIWLETGLIESEAKVTLKATINSSNPNAKEKTFSFTFDINFVVPHAAQ